MNGLIRLHRFGDDEEIWVNISIISKVRKSYDHTDVFTTDSVVGMTVKEEPLEVFRRIRDVQVSIISEAMRRAK